MITAILSLPDVSMCTPKRAFVFSDEQMTQLGRLAAERGVAPEDILRDALDERSAYGVGILWWLALCFLCSTLALALGMYDWFSAYDQFLADGDVAHLQGAHSRARNSATGAAIWVVLGFSFVVYIACRWRRMRRQKAE